MAEAGERPRVLIVDAMDAQATQRLAHVADVVYPRERTPLALGSAIRDVDGAIVRTTPLPRAVIEQGRRLRIIAKHGVGVDAVDLQCATERGIIVSHSPGVNAAAVAEFTLACILLLLKPVLAGTSQPRNRVRPGTANFSDAQYAAPLPRELRSVTVGIVGWGAIGRRVGEAVCFLGGQVTAYDPAVDAEHVEATGARRAASLDALLSQADIVTIHVPLTDATCGLIGAAELARMRPGAALVNTARARVVDEAALADAIRGGRLHGAAVDVLAEEPPAPEHPLLQLDSVICTPHLAGVTATTLQTMAHSAVDAVLSVFDGMAPAAVANPEVLPK